MIDRLRVARWEASVLMELERSDAADVRVVGLIDRSPRTRRPTSALYSTYEQVDRWLFREADDPFVITDLAGWMPRTPRVRLAAQPEDAQVDGLRGHDLDVLVVLGEPAVSLALAGPHGTARGGSTTGPLERGRPCAAVLGDAKRARCRLPGLVASVPEGDEVLYGSHSAIDPVSLQRSRAAAYWKTARFLVRRLSDLRRLGWEDLRSAPNYCGPLDQPNRDDGVPGADACAGTSRAPAGAWRAGGAREDDLPRGVVHRISADPPAPRGASRGPSRFRSPCRAATATGPIRSCWTSTGRPTSSSRMPTARRGVICCITLDASGKPSPRASSCSVSSISRTRSCSHTRAAFMVPESRSQRRVDLYRAVAPIPYRWEFVKTLMHDVEAADATLLAHDDKLWLFANVAEPGASSSDELCVFSAESLLGEWTPHPSNPIVSDIRRTRARWAPVQAQRIADPAGPGLLAPVWPCGHAEPHRLPDGNGVPRAAGWTHLARLDAWQPREPHVQLQLAL